MFGGRLLRAIPGGPPTGVQKSVVLRRVGAVCCGPASLFMLRRRAKVGDFTFILVEFLSCSLLARSHALRGNALAGRSRGPAATQRVGAQENFLLAPPGTDDSKRYRFRSGQVKLSGSEWLLADYRNRGVIIEADFLARESRTVEPHQRVLTPFPIRWLPPSSLWRFRLTSTTGRLTSKILSPSIRPRRIRQQQDRLAKRKRKHT